MPLKIFQWLKMWRIEDNDSDNFWLNVEAYASVYSSLSFNFVMFIISKKLYRLGYINISHSWHNAVDSSLKVVNHEERFIIKKIFL